jgi:hypothetical protein
MQLPQVIADLFKIWKMRDFWNTPGKARVYLGRRPKNCLRLRTQIINEHEANLDPRIPRSGLV